MGSQERSPGSGGYVRFIILSAARTGSHMLAAALDSHPNVLCFRELFNREHDFIQYGVEMYDEHDHADLTWRADDPLRFLSDRIFGGYPNSVRAVGFKYHYSHVFGFEGMKEHLACDTELRILHLQRRNMLRMFVSLKLAERTGIWLRPAPPVPPWRMRAIQAMKSTARRALWRPLGAASGKRKAAGVPGPELAPAGDSATPRSRVAISYEEFFEFIVKTELLVDHYAEMFSSHPILTVYYEDVLERREETLKNAQRFLGVPPKRLTERTQRQNPQPLTELIENHDELRAAFRETQHRWMFEEA